MHFTGAYTHLHTHGCMLVADAHISVYIASKHLVCACYHTITCTTISILPMYAPKSAYTTSTPVGVDMNACICGLDRMYTLLFLEHVILSVYLRHE